MVRRTGLLVALCMALGLVLTGTAAISAALPTCTATGFARDGINMTAAKINPAGTVSGDVDATGCNIAVYYNGGMGKIANADIHGANQFGVVVNGDDNAVAVDIINSSVHDIGETPFNGAQHGNAIYYRAFGTGRATGTVANNTVSRYQKNGITGNGAGTNLSILGNTVTGQGPVDFIGQNGIQLGFGASGQIRDNTVKGNAYTGAGEASSGGILIFGGCGDPVVAGVQVMKNTLVNNDVGIFLNNYNATCDGPAATMTNNKADHNTITNDAVTNTSGNITGAYQVGISDVGDNDKIINNAISGVGYSPTGKSGDVVMPIDTTSFPTTGPKVHANK